MSYVGGKGAAGVAQTIINQQPPHMFYIEPFAEPAASAVPAIIDRSTSEMEMVDSL